MSRNTKRKKSSAPSIKEEVSEQQMAIRLQAIGIGAVLNDADELAVHAIGFDQLRQARRWLGQNGYVNSGSFTSPAPGVFLITHIHTRLPDIKVVFCTTEPLEFLKPESNGGTPAILWPQGA